MSARELKGAERQAAANAVAQIAITVEQPMKSGELLELITRAVQTGIEIGRESAMAEMAISAIRRGGPAAVATR